MWSWRTLPDERVEVDKGDGMGFAVPVSGDVPAVHQTAERVLQWAELADKYGAKYGVPPSWILGVMFAESGGDPNAENPCCVGLMAIHLAAHGKTRDEMLDPDANLDYGTSLLAQSRLRGYSLPEAASIHVAGGGRDMKPHSGTCTSAVGVHPDFPDGSPWGMCEHMFAKTQGDGAVGYIDRVVRANNFMVDALAQRLPEPPRPIPWLAGQRGVGATVWPFALGAMAGYLALDWALPKLR
jgi:hypothetical protein